MPLDWEYLFPLVAISLLYPAIVIEFLGVILIHVNCLFICLNTFKYHSLAGVQLGAGKIQ